MHCFPLDNARHAPAARSEAILAAEAPRGALVHGPWGVSVVDA